MFCGCFAPQKQSRQIAAADNQSASSEIVKKTPSVKMNLDTGSTFGIIRDVPSLYNITRCGPELETHTKIVDVPSPFKSDLLVDDELEPSRYLSIKFEGIHDSHYIGINEIVFKDASGNPIDYTNIEVDGNEVDHDSTQPAFPPNGWWAVVGGDHSLVFDFGEVTHVSQIYFYCANSASTPKKMEISDSKSFLSDTSNDYSTEYYFQTAGEPLTDPTSVVFADNKSCEQVIESLNQEKPSNKFASFTSSDGVCHYVFYEKGTRTSAYNYYFGSEPDKAIQLAKNTVVQDGVEIPKVELRAMKLSELQAVRAIIISKCIEDKWISSYDKRKLRPEEVNLYDLNQSLILPLTERRNCAFKELFTTGDSLPTYYVSHWWGEPVLDFIRCCEYHAERHGFSPDEAQYWVCAYANRQHDLGADLGDDPSKSSFNKTMALARGVLLVCDMNLVVASRIWVDFELYRTVAMQSGLDITMHANGSPHLIAASGLPNETPYQKNKREQNFPFALLCKKMLKVELHKGDSSMPIDKVRILNTMIEHRPLDSDEVLQRMKEKNLEDPRYQQDLEKYAISDNAIKAEIACKAISVALSTEGQDYNDFHGFDLLKIIASDTLRKTITFNDIVSLDAVDDDVLVTLVKLTENKSIETFELNAKGCINVTNAALEKLEISDTLSNLSLNLGYAKNITNDALIKFISSKLPESLETLDLEVSGYKTPEGNYLPNRYSTFLEEFANVIPHHLNTLKLNSTLDDEDGGLEGLLQLARSLPSSTVSLDLTFEQWDNFKSDMIIEIAKALPSTLQNFRICFYNGDHIEDNDMEMLASEISNKVNLKSFTLYTRSHGGYGYYKMRDIKSLEEILNFSA